MPKIHLERNNILQKCLTSNIKVIICILIRIQFLFHTKKPFIFYLRLIKDDVIL